MTVLSLDLLVDAGLITASGQAVDLTELGNDEIRSRISHYSNARIETSESELHDLDSSDSLNALFSTGSANVSKERILSSVLVYKSIIIDDPLVSSSASISISRITEGLLFFSWAFELIKAGFVKILPLSFFNRPSSHVPLLHSDDAFRSSIPEHIHEFIHKNVELKSTRAGADGSIFVLSEPAEINKRSLLTVTFKDDYWVSGATLYQFGTTENGEINWDRDGVLTQDQFDRWSYQSVNQAMRSRLECIYNESHIGKLTGHTYVTESPFESELLAMAGHSECSTGHISAKFIQANSGFISIDSPSTLVELRDKHSEAFERFNYSLLGAADELHGLDPEEFEKKAELYFHKEIMPQVDAFRDNINSISSSGIKGTLASLVGISAAIATGSSLPLMTALMTSVAGGGAEAFPSLSQHQKMKHRPAYIWHRITKT